MEASDATTGPAFEILRQDDSPSYDPANPNARQWTIYFRTPSGTESQVTLPDDQYTPANVYAAVAAKVEAIEAVHQLGKAAGA